MTRNFILSDGGKSITVPQHASLDFRQTYEPIGGVSVLRLNDGAAVKQRHWRKLATTINGAGWLPPGVHTINYDDPIYISCAAPRAVASSDPTTVVPGDHRTDTGYEPFSRAFVDGQWVRHTIGETVPGAELYQLVYFPRLQVYAEPPRETLDADGAEYTWQITGEEV